MAKKVYQQPTLHIVKIQQAHIICTSPGGEGTGVHTDDSQDPSGAMTREYRGGSDWDDWDK